MLSLRVTGSRGTGSCRLYSRDVPAGCARRISVLAVAERLVNAATRLTSLPSTGSVYICLHKDMQTDSQSVSQPLPGDTAWVAVTTNTHAEARGPWSPVLPHLPLPSVSASTPFPSTRASSAAPRLPHNGAFKLFLNESARYMMGVWADGGK